MKLHHFVTAKAPDGGNRAREIGKVLAAPATRPVTEIKLSDIKKVDIRSSAKKDRLDKTEEMRAYAVTQLEGSSCAHNAYHKIKHYD